MRRRRLTVPSGLQKPVAYELLVEAGRMRAGLPLVGRPETRGIRRKHLVDENEIPVDQAEFEFGVRDDHPGALGLGAAVIVDLEAGFAHSMGQIVAEQPPALFPTDRLVVTFGRLGRRSEKRRGQLGRLAQSARHRVTAHRAVFFVFVPRGPGEIAPNDAFDRKRFRSAAKHASPGQPAREGFQVRGKRREVRRDEVIRHEIQPLEPEGRELRQDLAFARDRIGQDAVESGQPVARHQKHAVVRRVDLADFAAADQFPSGELQFGHRVHVTTGHPRPGKAKEGSRKFLGSATPLA